MSHKHQVEVLLRPAVEWYACVVSFSGAVVVWVLPDVLMLPTVVAHGSVAVLVLLGLTDAYRGSAVLRYRARLRKPRTFRQSMADLPISADRFYLGRGFRWTPVHTQRFVDTYDARYARFVKVPDNHDRLRWLRRALHRTRLDLLFTSLRLPEPSSGNPALHGVEPRERSVFMQEASLKGNHIVFGTTGAGKTRLLEVNVTQDIANNHVVIVIDPKGDGELLRRLYLECRRHGRLSEFYLFHLGFPDTSVRYNPIGDYSRITEMATRTANQLPSDGQAASFKEFGWRFVNIVARALHALGQRATYVDIRQAIDDIEPLMKRYFDQALFSNELWANRLDVIRGSVEGEQLPRSFSGRTVEGYCYYKVFIDFQQEVDDDLVSALAGSFKYEKSYYDKLVSSLGPLLEKLTAGRTGELLAPDYLDVSDTRTIMDWRSVIRKRGVVYVGLDAMTDATISGAVGQSMLADLTSIAGEIYKHGAFHGAPSREPNPVIKLHADEVNELIADEFIPLVNKCRGAGIVVTAYTQSLKDIEVKVGSEAKAGQIIDNFNNLSMLRVRSRETAELLTQQLPEVGVTEVMAVTGATDSDYFSGEHFTSRNEDRISKQKVSLVDPSSLMQLPNGHAFALVEAGRLYKIRLPLPHTTKDEADVPAYLDEMVGFMDKQPRKSDWSEEQLWWQ